MKYYFALKARDELGGGSPLSNVAIATTLGPPHVGVSPASLSADLFTGEQATRVVTLTNTGQAELNFKVLFTASAAGAPRAAARVRTNRDPPRIGDGGEHGGGIAGGPGAAPAPVAGDSPPVYPLGRIPYARGAWQPAGDRTGKHPHHESARRRNARADPFEQRRRFPDPRAARELPDLDAVDVMDGSSRVPSLAELSPYQSVIVVTSSAFGDPVGIGDVLADYVDAGGGVVLTLASFISGFEVRGRFLTGGYSPFNLGTGPIGSSQLGSFDASHPIMAGVTTASGDVLGAIQLAGGAELVASWMNGQPMVATKGRVAAVNVFVAFSGYWAGDIPLILHNAAFWSGGVSWLSAAPPSGVVPAGGRLDVVVTFDATGLDGGDYAGAVVVTSDDPANPRAEVPAHLHVTGRPDIAVQGDSVNVESVQTYSTDGAQTFHHLVTPFTASGAGVLELIADGDYGDLGEAATATAESTTVGSAGSSGLDCSPARGNFALDPARLAALIADGAVDVSVQNTPAVGRLLHREPAHRAAPLHPARRSSRLRPGVRRAQPRDAAHHRERRHAGAERDLGELR
jgi:hypothetical protein